METMPQGSRPLAQRAEWVPPQEPPLVPVPEEIPEVSPDEGPGEPNEVPTRPGEVPPPSPSEEKSGLIVFADDNRQHARTQRRADGEQHPAGVLESFGAQQDRVL